MGLAGAASSAMAHRLASMARKANNYAVWRVARGLLYRGLTAPSAGERGARELLRERELRALGVVSDPLGVQFRDVA